MILKPAYILLILTIFLIGEGESYRKKNHHVNKSDFCYVACPLNAFNWRFQWPTCGGSRQSPINLDFKTAQIESVDESTKLNFTLNGNRRIIPDIRLKNTGHSVQIDFFSKSQRWELNEIDLPGTYVAEQLHFHWATDPHFYSEHLLDGSGFPVELHIVTYKKEYGSVKEALKHEDGLAVVAKLYRVTSSNPEHMEHLYRKLAVYKDQLNTFQEIIINSLIDLPEILGDTSSYYVYDGSLTTPPCTENVKWIVCRKTGYINEGLLELMTTYLDHDYKRMYYNTRPIQPINNRLIKLKIEEQHLYQELYRMQQHALREPLLTK